MRITPDSITRREFAFVIFMTLFLKTNNAPIYNCNTVASATGEIDEGDFRKGDTPTLCIHFLPFKIKTGLKVTVDQSAGLTVRSGYDLIKSADTDIVIQLSNSAKLSPQIVT
jgi:hypothetical protein